MRVREHVTDHRVDDPDWICSGAAKFYEYSRLCKARPEPWLARRSLLQKFRPPGGCLSDEALKAGDHEVVLKAAERQDIVRRPARTEGHVWEREAADGEYDPD